MHHRHLHPRIIGRLALGFACAAAPRAVAQGGGAAPASPAPAPAQVAPRRPLWRLGTEVAFTDITGNRQLQLLQSSVTVARQTPETFNFDLKLEGRYGESNHVEAAKSAAARIRLDWTPRALLSPFLGLDWEYDHVRKIDTRLSAGVGVNLNLAYRDVTRATLAAGLVEEYVNYAAPTSPGEANDTRFHARLAVLHTLRTGVQAEFNAKYQPATGRLWDYLLKIDGALRMALTTKLAWRTTYTWNRASNPAPGVMGDDRTLTTGLLIQWW